MNHQGGPVFKKDSCLNSCQINNKKEQENLNVPILWIWGKLQEAFPWQMQSTAWSSEGEFQLLGHTVLRYWNRNEAVKKYCYSWTYLKTSFPHILIVILFFFSEHPDLWFTTSFTCSFYGLPDAFFRNALKWVSFKQRLWWE